MKQRFYLLGLVFVLLLVSLGTRNILDLALFGDAELWGGLPAAALINALPCGIFAAAAVIAALGIGMQLLGSGCAVSLLPSAWAPAARLWTRRCLWSAWPVLALSPGYSSCIWSDSISRRFLEPQLWVSLVLLVICHLLQARLIRDYGKIKYRMASVIIVLVALSCGAVWWGGRSVEFLLLALWLPFPILLWKKDATPIERRHLCWMLAGLLTLSFLIAGSSFFFLSGENEAPSPRFSLYCLPLLALLHLLPAIRRRLYAVRTLSGATLLYGLAFNAAMLANASLLKEERLPLYIGSYAAALLLLIALIALHRYTRETPNSPGKKSPPAP